MEPGGACPHRVSSRNVCQSHTYIECKSVDVLSFYERAVKIKHFTADRPTGRKPIVAASPASVETNDFNQLCRHSAPHHNVMSSSETEKQCGGRRSPTTVLLEPQWTTAFPGRARGVMYIFGLRLTQLP